jgi:hypothetical protein
MLILYELCFVFDGMDWITHLDTLSHRFLFCFYSCPFGRDSHDIRHFAIQSFLLAFGYPAFVVLLSLTIYVGVISVWLAWLGSRVGKGLMIHRTILGCAV